MIQNFIQEQVDTLARTLQRSVAIDDVGINLVAVSKHFDDADDARVRAILARTLEEDSCRYLFSFGIVARKSLFSVCKKRMRCAFPPTFHRVSTETHSFHKENAAPAFSYKCRKRGLHILIFVR